MDKPKQPATCACVNLVLKPGQSSALLICERCGAKRWLEQPKHLQPA